MAWRIELSSGARKALDHLDKSTVHRLLRFLHERVAPAEHPRTLGKPLQGSRLGNLWRYRVGDYRIIADLQDHTWVVLVVRIGHRREVYR
jgi:mRNA interferase RelE/StbE